MQFMLKTHATNHVVYQRKFYIDIIIQSQYAEPVACSKFPFIKTVLKQVLRPRLSIPKGNK